MRRSHGAAADRDLNGLAIRPAFPPAPGGTIFARQSRPATAGTQDQPGHRIMTNLLLRLAPAAALLALLAGCTGYAPPPMAQIGCQQQEPLDAGANYLNCVQGWIAQNGSQAQQAAR